MLQLKWRCGAANVVDLTGIAVVASPQTQTATVAPVNYLLSKVHARIPSDSCTTLAGTLDAQGWRYLRANAPSSQLATRVKELSFMSDVKC